jgi:flagellar biosynthesis/type III secretory pathway protein FliH
MTIAQKLRNEGHREGHREGHQEGRQEGVWMGRLQTLQEIMGLAVDTAETLTLHSLEKLRRRFEDLQAEYKLRHKNGEQLQATFNNSFSEAELVRRLNRQQE